MEIEKVFVRDPTNILYKILTYMQKWRVLLKAGERERHDGLADKLRVWIQYFVKKRGEDDGVFGD